VKISVVDWKLFVLGPVRILLGFKNVSYPVSDTFPSCQLLYKTSLLGNALLFKESVLLKIIE
jgi:hypothetical protein